jgi:hypothetical protein
VKIFVHSTAAVIIAALCGIAAEAAAQGKPEKDRIRIGYAVDSAVQAVINHLAEGGPKYAKFKPADFIDSGPWSELDKSDYIDKLYGGHAK